MQYIIFDFNGTILDDTDVCIEAENRTIKHFGLNRPELTKEEYLDIFTFPVKNYYEKVGFDWSLYSYEEVGKFWFDNYCALKNKYKVHDGVIDFLKKSHEKGYKNIVLSASSLDGLKRQLKDLNIEEYFDEVLGIDNIYAGSKVDIALEWIKDKDPKQCLMLGDTLHDLEAARSMNVDCILIANGHQPKYKLVANYDKVVDSIEEVKI